MQIFDQINEQLSEGHTVYEMTISDENEKSLIAELTDNNWASVIGACGKLHNHGTNTPIILQNSTNQTMELVKRKLATLFGYIGNGMQNNR